MLSTVSSKGFGADGGAGRVCARFSCGKINDKMQSTMPARRRFLVFILFLKGRQLVFAPFVFSSRLCVKFRVRRPFHAKAQRKTKGAKEAGRAEVSGPVLPDRLHRAGFPARHAFLEVGGVRFISLAFRNRDVCGRQRFRLLACRPQEVCSG